MGFLNPQSYKKNQAQDVYRDTVLKQYAKCVELGSNAVDSILVVLYLDIVNQVEQLEI